MRKYVIIFMMMILSVDLSAQYTSINKIVLPILQLDDQVLLDQIDSVLFIEHPCMSSFKNDKRQYVYFVSIKEDSLKSYDINIVYAKPSEVENDINTGIYDRFNKIWIIREDSNTPLFKHTGEKTSFEYKKELTKRKENELVEIIYPEEFCIWGLSSFENKIKVLDLEGVKNTSKYK
ncbi:hypothetical protein M2451_003552 [Dysgonomonas sp. PFB1-18]|uniref:hypothetical protein n=1 Tax=unclassified Dysgonomonas TaxID=2630389 RepID=UPI0024745C7A|nr:MULTISPECIES: hypothetical protein [unclassified Dysgonomonas]MDH6310681.1 hypothetical protein [Dysgonomonas sp. PF1-14]MDH6340532.1 hypothetical protein [Dysgonomonas sp. PF1-16]MDH6382212.1 hypothetical protein [Dysgonomonas sp. PFB1-18]MDH6399555.1 hypothetical protein [Dysgonomonas sp. PF1-23]